MIKKVSIKKVSALLLLVFMLMGSSTAFGHYIPDLDSDSSGMRTDKKILNVLPQTARIVIERVSADIIKEPTR